MSDFDVILYMEVKSRVKIQAYTIQTLKWFYNIHSLGVYLKFSLLKSRQTTAKRQIQMVNLTV